MGSSSPGITVVVILAAGAGSRFRGAKHKLLADLDGYAVSHWAIRAAIDARVGDVLVITGAIDLGDVLAGLADRATAAGVAVSAVENPRWAEGQATSLHAAIGAATARGADAIVVGLADQPFVTAEAWRRVAASDAPIAVATYGGQAQNPVRLHRSVWSDVPSTGDIGARSVIRLRADIVEPVPCPGSGADIDTFEELQSWQNRSSTNSP